MAHAVAEGRWIPRRALELGGEQRAGQLLEEIASARVRGHPSTQAGREVLGLGHVPEEPAFIEGSRIRDAAGATSTDGVIAIRHADRLEIVAVVEAKAGSFAAGGLTESVAGLRRTRTTDIIQAVIEASGGSAAAGLSDQRAMKRRLSNLLSPDQYRWIYHRGERREPGEKHTGPAGIARSTGVRDRPPARPDRRVSTRRGSRGGEGQISRDLERLMKEGDGTVPTIIDHVAMTATLTSRPSFLGAAPTDVPLSDINAQLTGQGYVFRPLEMGVEGMTTQQLDELADGLVDALGDDLIDVAKP